jgi:hypothetical protein
MQEIEVDVIEAELAEARLKGARCLVGAVFAQPKFGRDENIAAV